MEFICGTESYYKKMLELQEKLRKSEEERFKLEEKFNEMMQMTRDAEHERLRILRHKYHRFLEQDKVRQERNENIVRSLDRIENRARMLAAKTERFAALRKQYDKYIKRLHTSKGEEIHQEYTTPHATQEQAYSGQTYARPRKKLFSDMTTSENPEAKLAMLEKFLRDNFQNFPRDPSQKSKENVLNNNRILNEERNLKSSADIPRNDNLSENIKLDQRYMPTKHFATIDSDSKESQEYEDDFGNIPKSDELDIFASKISEKSKNKIASVTPRKKSALLGNVIEQELQKLHSKDLKQSSPSEEIYHTDNKANETDPYVRNYKDMVSKSEEKYGLKQNKVNVSPKHGDDKNENLPKVRNETSDSDKLEKVMLFSKVPTENEICTGDYKISPKMRFAREPQSENVPKQIESDSENLIIKKYKEVTNALINEDTTFMTSERDEVESSMKSVNDNENINKNTVQPIEDIYNKGKFNNNVKGYRHSASKEYRVPEMQQTQREQYTKHTFNPESDYKASEPEQHSVQKVGNQYEDKDNKTHIPVEVVHVQENREKQLNMQSSVVLPQEQIDEGKFNIPNSENKQIEHQYNNEKSKQLINQQEPQQLINPQPKPRKLSIIQPETIITENEKQNIEQKEFNENTYNHEYVEKQRNISPKHKSDIKQTNVVDRSEYNAETNSSNESEAVEQNNELAQHKSSKERVHKENIKQIYVEQQVVAEPVVAEEYSNQNLSQKVVEDQVDPKENIDQNYIPEQEQFEDPRNYEMYNNLNYPAGQETTDGIVYQEGFNENYPPEDSAIYQEQINDQNYDYQPGYENQQYETSEQYPEQQEYQSQEQYQEEYTTENYSADQQQYQQDYPDRNYEEYSPQTENYPLRTEEYPPQAGEYPPQAGEYPPQAEEYPLQAGEYPSQAGEYPPQVGEYPPQVGEYPPQVGEYPPQVGEYPPQTGEYPPQAEAYPPQVEEYPPQAGEYPPQTREYPPQTGEYHSQAGEYHSQAREYPPQAGEYSPQTGEYAQGQYSENYNIDQQFINPGDVKYNPEEYPGGYDQNLYQSEQEYLQGEQNIDMQYQNEQSENTQDYPQPQEDQPANIQEGYSKETSGGNQQDSAAEQHIPEQAAGNVGIKQETKANTEGSTSESTVKSESPKNLEEKAKPLVEKKLSNLAEMLDTDTESVKEETKISNDSDFDFSNA